MTEMQDFLNTDRVTILVVEDEILTRAALGEYLRDCGYRVVEAASSDEAVTLLNEPTISIDIVLTAVEIPGSLNGFELAKWTRINRPGKDVILAGTLEATAETAGELCKEGQESKERAHVSRPYEPPQLLDYIKRLRSSLPNN